MIDLEKKTTTESGGQATIKHEHKHKVTISFDWSEMIFAAIVGALLWAYVIAPALAK